MTLGLCRINRLDKIHRFHLDKIHRWKLDKIQIRISGKMETPSPAVDSHGVKTWTTFFQPRGKFHFDKTHVHCPRHVSETYVPKSLEICGGHFDKGRRITNLVRCHNALIPILLTNRFAATFLLFAPASIR